MHRRKKGSVLNEFFIFLWFDKFQQIRLANRKMVSGSGSSQNNGAKVHASKCETLQEQNFLFWLKDILDPHAFAGVNQLD